MTSFVREGRIWKFGDQINTDVMLPGSVIRAPIEEQRQQCMEAIRPGWSKRVKEGDIIVAGGGFGTGSSRPAAAVLYACGIRGIVANSVNALFLRACVNACLPALALPDVVALFDEGDVARLNFGDGIVENLTKGTRTQTRPLPPFLLSIVEKGGLINMLVEGGYIEPTAFVARGT